METPWTSFLTITNRCSPTSAIHVAHLDVLITMLIDDAWLRLRMMVTANLSNRIIIVVKVVEMTHLDRTEGEQRSEPVLRMKLLP